MQSEIFAIAASFCFAISGMIIGELHGRVGLFRLARWQMLAATLLTATISVIHGDWNGIELWQVAYLCASSLFGIVIASTTYYAAIYACGAHVTALLFTLTSPFALALGYGIFDEKVSGQQGLGVLLVLLGIVLAIGLPGSKGQGTGDRLGWWGMVLGVVTALGQAIGSLWARPAMASGVDPFTAMTIRAGLGALFFVAIQLLPIRAMRTSETFSWNNLSMVVVSALFGTGLGMSLLMAALAGGKVGIVSTLSSLTPVVILPMVWFRTGRAPPPSAWIGALLAVAGTAAISLK